MKVLIAGTVACFLLCGTIGDAHAAPNLRAYCAAHKNDPGPGEIPSDAVPADVKAAMAGTWRCMNGIVLVCNPGADGSACLRYDKMDARRMKAFRQFCQESPDNNFVPMVLSTGLASTWRCENKEPVQMTTVPLDRLGYRKSTWRPLY